MPELLISSPAFASRGWIPRRHTARGEDVSPELVLTGLDDAAASLAITLDDASHPLFPNYNHWCIWNIPACAVIPEGIPHGAHIDEPFSACQGMAYGRHCYRGPKPPLRTIHDYAFTAYALDCMLDLPEDATRDDLLAAAEGHILQKATLVGKYQRGR